MYFVVFCWVRGFRVLGYTQVSGIAPRKKDLNSWLEMTVKEGGLSMQFPVCLRAIICISVDTVLIRIVGDDHMEFSQGRPFGFEVECVTADGEPTQGQLFFFSIYRQILSGYKHN